MSVPKLSGLVNSWSGASASLQPDAIDDQAAGGGLRMLVSKIRGALDSGDAVTAVLLSNALIEEFPAERQGLVLKAQAHAAQGQLAEALATVRLALQTRAYDAKLLSFARNLSLQQGGIEAAAEYIARLSEVAPGDIKNRLFAIDLKLASGQFADGLDLAAALVVTSPEFVKAHLLKAQALIELDRPAEALEVLRQALAEHPADLKLLGLARSVAFGQGQFEEAVELAETISTLSPENQKNSAFLIQSLMAAGRFDEALEHADRLIGISPSDGPALLLRCQALIAVHRSSEAIDLLSSALTTNPDDRRLLSFTRNAAFQNARFELAAECALRMSQVEPKDGRNQAFVLHAYMAAGRFAEVGEFIDSLPSTTAIPFLSKEAHHYERFVELQQDFPVMIAAWQASLKNVAKPTPTAPSGAAGLNATMIQYWSQGAPPADVQIVCDNWRRLLEQEGLGRVRLFDRESAAEWIDAHAPEFAALFSKAFHYAMDSDILRIAYASKHPCIYMDIDSWPLDHSADILRFALRRNRSMLYLRAHRPWIANGFFVSVPGCPFFEELVSQCLAIDLDSMKQDYMVIEGTFGPTRYNVVLRDLVTKASETTVRRCEGVPGCSTLSIDGYELNFSHEAAVAAVRPPFPLGYKVTGDYWKYFTPPLD